MGIRSRQGDSLYKHGLFSGYTDFRYGAPHGRKVTLPAVRQERPIFSFGKRKHMISLLAVELADWRSSPFEKEGPLRHALRSRLCLDGNGWHRSNAEAVFVIDRAIKQLGLTRPSWDDGQPGATENPDRCARCGSDVENAGNGKAARFCSVECAKSEMESRNFARRDESDRAFAAAARVVRRSKTTARACEDCGARFQPIREKSKQRFCSFSCGAKSRARQGASFGMNSSAVTVACVYCSEDFEARQKTAITCSPACNRAWAKLKTGKEAVFLKPHVFDRYITANVNAPAITSQRFDFLLWQSGCTITEEVSLPAPRVTDALFSQGQPSTLSCAT